MSYERTIYMDRNVTVFCSFFHYVFRFLFLAFKSIHSEFAPYIYKKKNKESLNTRSTNMTDKSVKKNCIPHLALSNNLPCTLYIIKNNLTDIYRTHKTQ